MAAELADLSFPAPLHTGELLDALSTGIVLLDQQLCVRYANIGAQDLLGISLRQARGLPIGDLFAGAQPLIDLLQRELEDNKILAGHEFVLTPVATLPSARAPAVVDFTVTTLEDDIEGKLLLLRTGRRARPAAHRARERIARARRRQPADDSSTRA